MALRVRNIPGTISLAMLALTLLVYNFGGWFLYELARDLAEREMERKLVAIGRTAALDLSEEAQVLLLLLDPSEGADAFPDWMSRSDRLTDLSSRLADLSSRLAALKEANGLESATVLERSMAVLADADPATTPGAILATLDALIVEEAFTSHVVTVSPYYRFRGEDHKRCYAPMRNLRGQTVAVLGISAGRDYFAELSRMRAYLFAIAGIGSLLLVGVAVALYRLLSRAVRTERAMADADRLQSLGTLAAGIAHEIRNPLGIIRAISEELEAELEDEPEERRLLADITEEVKRLNDLVSRFLTFARPDSGQAAPEAFDLGDTLEGVVDLVRKGTGSPKVSYVLEREEDLPPLEMEEKSIRQVLFNVLLNARDAVGADGRIAVRLDCVGRSARVTVVDDGAGMSVRQVKRVFDPFYTTKASGTGLGLSISRNIVERYGGRIEIESEERRGTRVTVILPFTDGAE